jgi:hypothetical protein
MIARPLRSEHANMRAGWFALLGGNAGWSLHLLLGYLSVSLYCHPGAAFHLAGMSGFVLTFAALTLTTLAIAGWATVTGWHIWQQEGASWHGFLGLMGMMLGGLFAATILLQGMPILFVQPCSVGG